MDTTPFYIYLDREIKRVTRSADMIERFSKMYQNKLNATGSLSEVELNSLFSMLQKECKKIEAIKAYQPQGA